MSADSEMLLRDRFAIEAMKVFLPCIIDEGKFMEEPIDGMERAMIVAIGSYEMADAMLKARAKQ